MENLTISKSKSKILNENYVKGVSNDILNNERDGVYSIQAYVNMESYNDPNFYRWLFDEDSISDFGSNLTEDQMKIAIDFIDSL